MPDWIIEGYSEFAKRLPHECRLHLIEIAPGRRSKAAAAARAVQEEGERMLAALPKDCQVIALDARGTQWSTQQLQEKLADWQRVGRDIALLIGGPDGLAEACLTRAEHVWSLSNLTLPHRLVRVILAEQLYRAWSTLNRHPYHR